MDSPKTSRILSRGCLAMIAMTIGLALACLWGLNVIAERSREEAAKRRAADVAEEFERVRGSKSVHIMCDSKLLALLANDAESVQNLTELDLSMVDLDAPETAAAKQLSNVRLIRAYSCHGIRKLLEAMQGSPAVEEIVFETTSFSPDDLQLLATFPNLKVVRFVDYAVGIEKVIDESLRKRLRGVKLEFTPLE